MRNCVAVVLNLIISELLVRRYSSWIIKRKMNKSQRHILCVLIISFTSVLGTYIRTSDGRIFAIRAANKAKTAEESTTASPKGRKINSALSLKHQRCKKIRHYKGTTV